MRRAELLGLGADDKLTEAVLATRLATDLTHGAFWRTVWIFLITNAGGFDRAQVAPAIDFLNSIRHERVPVETADATIVREPPDPHFSMKGRTARSLLRLMDRWHRGLAGGRDESTWARSRLRPFLFEESSQEVSVPLVWELTELTTSAQLRAEGAALHHCVASYRDRCRRGVSRIWSLRLRRAANVRSVLTVEVDPHKHAVVQARGFRNRRASGKPLRLLEAWAVRENLRVSI